MRTRVFAWVLAVIALLLPAMAQAASVTISNIRFSDEVGNDERFKWSVEWAPDSRFDLEVGEEAVVIYGALIIQDLPVSPAKAGDGDDSFQVAFDISPTEKTLSVQGAPEARFFPDSVSVSVDFDNTPHAIPFGEGGALSLTFLDSSKIENSGFYLLTAKIELISAPRSVDETLDEAITTLTEPANPTLLGSNLIGLDAAKR